MGGKPPTHKTRPRGRPLNRRLSRKVYSLRRVNRAAATRILRRLRKPREGHLKEGKSQLVGSHPRAPGFRTVYIRRTKDEDPKSALSDIVRPPFVPGRLRSRLQASLTSLQEQTTTPPPVPPRNPLRLQHGEMAARVPSFLESHAKRLHNLTEAQNFARQEAKEQEAAIHEKLRRAHEPLPPYEFLALIGKGTYGRVYLARDLKKERYVALKVLDVDSVDYKIPLKYRDESLNDFAKEAKVLNQLKSCGTENINQLYEVLVVHSQLWFISEYCPGGSVHTLMQATNNKLEERYIIPIARELAKALKGVHDAEIMHRDVKAANVMIHENGGIQLIDFGVARLLETPKEKRHTFIGTLHFMGPEQVLERGHSMEVDTWAFGCTLVEMATGHPPNAMIAQRAIEAQYRRGGVPKLKPQDGYSQELCDLVAFTLVHDPDKRPSMEEILAHPYLHDTEETHSTDSLAELVQMFERWASTGGQRQSLLVSRGAAAAEFPADRAIQEGWRFSTFGMLEDLEGQFSHLGIDPESHSLGARSSLHQDPIADMASLQVQEDVMASYFGDQTLHGNPHTDFAANTSSDTEGSVVDYAPSNQESPTGPDMATAANEVRLQRGQNHLLALYNQDQPDYVYPDLIEKVAPAIQPSDLPLRAQHAESSETMSKEADASNLSRGGSNINLKIIEDRKATRTKERAARDTMNWNFPSGGHANLSDWTPSYEAGAGDLDSWTPSYQTPSENANIPRGSRLDIDELMGANENVNIPRASRIDLDDLMGDATPAYASLASSTLYAPPPQPTVEPIELAQVGEGDNDSIYMDSLDSYDPEDPVAIAEEAHGREEAEEEWEDEEDDEGDDDDLLPGVPNMTLIAGPSAGAMAEGAPPELLGAELERLMGHYMAGMQALEATLNEAIEEMSSDEEEGQGQGGAEEAPAQPPHENA